MATAVKKVKNEPTQEVVEPVEKQKEETSPKKTESKSEIDTLKEQLAQLQAQLSMMQTVVQPTPAPKKSNKKIKFVSLVTGALILRGSRVWRFEHQFDSKQFTEKEANMIIGNMPNLISTGIIFIDDADFISENQLDGMYDAIMNETQLKGLFKKNSEDIIKAYRRAVPAQQEIIVSMIQDKCLKGEYVDANVKVEIGKLAKVDFLSIEAEE